MIKRAQKEDAEALAALATQLWPGHDPAGLAQEYRALTQNADAACFLKSIGGRPVGFAQCQLRHDYVEGTDSSPVGYLEGVFVAEEYRRLGFAAALLAECEKWAKAKGCTEFASDCELDNADSLRFHLAMGFTEANRIICFRKELNGSTNMREENKRGIARRGDWKTKPMPEQRETFVLNRTFSDGEMAALRRGHVPEAMEDKWFWYMEGSTLWAHRSWTGYCIYRIDFQNGRQVVTVNRDPEQYGCASVEEDAATLNKLLDQWAETPYDHYHAWLSETCDALEKAGQV